MSVAVPRSKTPVSAAYDTDASARVEPSDAADLTEPEIALPTKMTPVLSGPVDVARSRKQTLVSPIPALLAAQMTEIHEDRNDATPLPIGLRGEATSRFAVSAQEALLREDESEYVVELLEPDKSGDR